MDQTPYTIHEPTEPLTPLVVGSPHSGRAYPADFGFSCPFELLRQAEDIYVDELAAGAVDCGATLLCAAFPRSYIDVNRAENDLDAAVLAEAWPEKLDPSPRTALGLGLVRRLCAGGVPMYAAPLAAATVRRRLETCYRPYHAALARLLAARQAMFGAVWLVDCHSMPAHVGANMTRRVADFVLGDRDGTSCDPAFTRKVHDALLDMGYSVALNDPYKGVEIMRRYGQPALGRQALQLEINRDLYRDANTLEKNAGFARTRQDLTRLFNLIAADIATKGVERQAAE